MGPCCSRCCRVGHPTHTTTTTTITPPTHPPPVSPPRPCPRYPARAPASPPWPPCWSGSTPQTRAASRWRGRTSAGSAAPSGALPWRPSARSPCSSPPASPTTSVGGRGGWRRCAAPDRLGKGMEEHKQAAPLPWHAASLPSRSPPAWHGLPARHPCLLPLLQAMAGRCGARRRRLRRRRGRPTRTSSSLPCPTGEQAAGRGLGQARRRLWRRSPSMACTLAQRAMRHFQARAAPHVSQHACHAGMPPWSVRQAACCRGGSGSALRWPARFSR